MLHDGWVGVNFSELRRTWRSYVPSGAPRVTASAPPTARKRNTAVPMNSPMAGIYHRCRFETKSTGLDILAQTKGDDENVMLQVLEEKV